MIEISTSERDEISADYIRSERRTTRDFYERRGSCCSSSWRTFLLIRHFTVLSSNWISSFLSEVHKDVSLLAIPRWKPTISFSYSSDLVARIDWPIGGTIDRRTDRISVLRSCIQFNWSIENSSTRHSWYSKWSLSFSSPFLFNSFMPPVLWITWSSPSIVAVKPILIRMVRKWHWEITAGNAISSRHTISQGLSQNGYCFGLWAQFCHRSSSWRRYDPLSDGTLRFTTTALWDRFGRWWRLCSLAEVRRSVVQRTEYESCDSRCPEQHLDSFSFSP